MNLDENAREKLISKSRGKIECKKDSESWCPRCRARITTSPKSGREYGHQKDCPRRPDDLHNRGNSHGYDPAQDKVLNGEMDSLDESEKQFITDGGFSSRTEPGQFELEDDSDELDLVASTKEELIGARISGVANYQGQPHTTRIENDEIVQIQKDKEGHRVFLTRPVREDGTLEGCVREVPVRVFDCDRVEPSGGEQ